ncbi:uncharacterized protein LOC124160383 [Ischnura elegans]|uniref:uncharacterized protein LOC124160383 n=1 Tax=Ischnura elegans TaxID=197161 RepID=UPI001ED870C3|nr:uncharacterized protein LOC124160383 [Ischnura elegans]
MATNRQRFGATFCLATVFVLSLLLQDVQSSAVREISPHEIREALLSIGATMRNYGDKLERHEGRERQLGDTLRRALASVDKRVALLQRSSEERHRELERFLIQAEERERIQLQKATQNMEALGSMLEARLSNIEAILQSHSTNQGDGTPNEVPCIKLLEPKIELLQQKMGNLEETVQSGARELSKSYEHINKFEEGLSLNLDKSDNIMEYLLNNKMKDGDSTANIGSTSEEIKSMIMHMIDSLKLLNEDSTRTQQSVLPEIGRATATLEQLREDLRRTNKWQEDLLVQKLNEVQNSTITAIDAILPEDRRSGNEDTCQIREELTAVKEGIKALTDLTETTQTELEKELRKESNRVIAESRDLTDEVVKRVDTAEEALSPAPLIKILTNLEHVIIQAADGVMNVGRRVEHGNLRVISELGEEIKTTSSAVETKISSRLDNLAASVLVNQTGAMETLSQKVESEISQVWRQIGIMYQQLTQSVGMLDKLQVQTENYVNGSLKSMGSVEGRVGQIGEKVGEVEGNLNFLLGRLSLVSTEFNLVKAGLAEALDDVRRNMASVNNNMREAPKGTEYDHVNQVSPIQDE